MLFQPMPFEPTPGENVSSSRLEAFSDGVIAVIITIMVLELKVPAVKEMSTADALHLDLRMVAVYLLSFVQTGIYWVNHHYLIDGGKKGLGRVSHSLLWSNLAFLFCLSFIPFGTQWIGVRGITPVPVAVYAVCFVAPAVAWMVLSTVLCRQTGVRPANGPIIQTVSAILNISAIFVALYSPWTALGMIGFVAFLWLLPPREIVKLTRKSVHPPTDRPHSR
jgi:uncharacterized membrane protein